MIVERMGFGKGRRFPTSWVGLCGVYWLQGVIIGFELGLIGFELGLFWVVGSGGFARNALYNSGLG